MYEYRTAGIKRCDLIPVKQKLNAVSKAKINIYGALILRLSGQSATGENFFAAAIVYVSPDISRFYMSQHVMVLLGIVPQGFPNIGAARHPELNVDGLQTDASGACDCPRRSPPPGRPDKLPMPATVENIDKMKEWLLDTYKASVFNKCPHQPFPTMKGPPMRIHVDPNAKPTAVTVPAKVPIHWEPQVEEDLQQDIDMSPMGKHRNGCTECW